MAAAICTRIYTPDRESQYKDQLNIWRDRLHIDPILFNTNLTNIRDRFGHQLYQAIPIFPSVIDLGMNYRGQGWSEPEAWRASLSRIPWAQFPVRPDSIAYKYEYCADNSVIATPCLIMYGEYTQLTRAIGEGTSRAKAEENAAEILLCSGYYCFTT